ncbi:unnamed protein product [Mycena citricolor]|uniref:Uncharacterized protein n=1 Tax=Mycena citricolor TaxID=2018698 RepID=A0AAD2K4E3_9AGAR|nr:unnamed protein product [Mycena citricolor]
MLVSNKQMTLTVLLPEQPDNVPEMLTHLDSLNNYWLTESLWKSWSDYGWTHIAHILKCTIDGVILTANHLESFNGVLKGAITSADRKAAVVFAWMSSSKHWSCQYCCQSLRSNASTRMTQRKMQDEHV